MYGSRMLLDFYGNKLNPDTSKGLSNARDAATISRKAFRLFKSLSCIANILRMLGSDPNYRNSSDPGVVICRMLEETFYVRGICAVAIMFSNSFLENQTAFYYHDNKYLLARLGLASFDINKENDRANFTWFIAEAFGFSALLLQYRAYLTRLKSVRWRITRLRTQLQQQQQSTPSSLQVRCTSSMIDIVAWLVICYALRCSYY